MATGLRKAACDCLMQRGNTKCDTLKGEQSEGGQARNALCLASDPVGQNKQKVILYCVVINKLSCSGVS